MKIPNLVFAIIFIIVASALAENKGLLLDDFEGRVCAGMDGTVDFGSGAGSSLEVSGAADIKYSGKQSLKLDYDAVSDGYMWAARGFDLDAKNTAWLVKPKDIDWQKFKAISFYMYGSDSKTKIAFDIKDSGNEIWRSMVEDNFKGWKKITFPLNEFFARGDWQPNNADKNAILDFPVKSFQFEPRPIAKGTLYFDYIALEEK